MDEGQNSIDYVIVLRLQVFQILHPSKRALVLLFLVNLQRRNSLVDFSCESHIRKQDKSFYILIVIGYKVLYGFRDFGIEVVQGIILSKLLLQDPGESALPDENSAGQFIDKSGIKFVEWLLDFEVLEKEFIPASVALGLEIFCGQVTSLDMSFYTYLWFKAATRISITLGSQVRAAWLQTRQKSSYCPYSQRSRYMLWTLWFMVLCLRGSRGAQFTQNPYLTGLLRRLRLIFEEMILFIICY